MRNGNWSRVWVVALVLALAACGAASAGPLAVPAGPTATPTAPGTGETTGPPPSTLTAAGQTQTGDLGSPCWATQPSVRVCADTLGLPVPEERLPVTAGGTAVFRFGGTTPPAEVRAAAYPLAGQPLSEAGGRRWLLGSGAPPPHIDLPTTLAGHEVTIAVAVPAGEYVVLVQVRAQDGSASYGFHVVVQP